MSLTNIETFSAPALSNDEIMNRRRAERNRKKLRRTGRQVLLATGVSLAIVGIGLHNSRRPNPAREKMKAALVAKEIPTSNPNIVLEPYTVGTSSLDTMISEVAADIDPMLSSANDAQDQMSALDSYLTKSQQKIHAFTPGEHLKIAVDTQKGAILPKQDIPK